jgi:hypothetical protein
LADIESDEEENYKKKEPEKSQIMKIASKIESEVERVLIIDREEIIRRKKEQYIAKIQSS